MASLRDSLHLNTRSALAVDFGADFVAVRHAPPGADWVELGAVSVEAPDFAAEMTALADVARKTTGGDMRAELWLPARQIVNLEIQDQPRLDFLARRGAVTDLADAVGISPDQLSYDLAARRADGSRSACATETSTVEEARSHAIAWGFEPTIITTRHAGPAFTRPPRFDGAKPHGRAAPFIAVAAVAVLALAVGGFLWMKDGPYEPPAVNLDTVATAPTQAHESSLPESKLSLDAAENAPVQKGALSSVGSPDVEVSAPKEPETALEFSVASDSMLLPTPEADAPLMVQDEARAAADGIPSGGVALTETPEPQVVRDFVADQTPVAPLSPELAAMGASETADAGLMPQADVPPRGDFAIAAAASVSGDQTVPAPVPPLSERAPAPETEIASVDPAEFAEEAEKWVEAEAAAEEEAGATVPAALTDDGAPADEAATGPEGIDPAEIEPEEGALTDDGSDAISAEPDLELDPEAPPAALDPAQLALLPPPAPPLGDNDGPVLAESDDFDDIDFGPGPGSVLTSPSPTHRPAALDMTPSDLAVLTAPVPGHRPASIKPRPKAIGANTRTATAPKRGRPSGPGLSRAATLHDVIPLDDLSLLGTFGQGKSRRALLRMPSGEIKRVSRGDVVQGWVIGKIETLSMRITRGGEARTLPLAR